jgi:pullulanase/glycogen debranching enzyme
MMFENWTSPESHCFGALLNAEIEGKSEALLIIMNSFHYETTFELPNTLFPAKWECLLDTASKTGCEASRPAKAVTVAGRSLQLLHGIPVKAS